MTLGKKKSEAKSGSSKLPDAEKQGASESDDSEAASVKDEKKSDAPRCLHCNSTQVHIRISDGATVCHRCGKVRIPERRK